MNKESLKEYLSSKYQGWKSFLENIIFPIFGDDDFEDGYEAELLDSQPERKQLAESTGIRSIKQVGKMYVGVEPLQIFDVTVSDRVMMERNRVNIQRLIRSVMDQYSCAFMIFHYQDDTRWDWRFSYCRKSGNREESTDSKRYTFLLGPGQSCRTATDNFMDLYEKRDNLEITDITKAFSVEALSDRFFKGYKEQYEKFVNYMIDPDNGMRQYFIDTDFDHTGLNEDKIREREEKPIRDYVKKLLGRIVFLHFLQKKGWLGVPAGKQWGDGDRDFMLHLFQNASDSQKANFLDDILEDLFAEGLDYNRSDCEDIYDTKVEGFRNCRIPYLNGGLFERDDLDQKPSHFPSDYFNELLTMLSQYNFTIDENDPDDAEIGVDPEMLGRIFENLLEDNKDKGAYYTPKEIVQYMCRESLIAYLQNNQNEEDKERIRQFVTTHDASLLGNLKEYIDKKLCDVKICDPAIGSGAFPMGLLRELFFCRSAIEPNIVENAVNIKRHIIQNNIYGVDIEKGAVDIARLRFWLTLVVDEATPDVLPNLDYKIMQGNSLFTTFDGKYLNISDSQKHTKMHKIRQKKALLSQKQKQFFEQEGEQKLRTSIEIKNTILDIVALQLGYELESWAQQSAVQGALFQDMQDEAISMQKIKEVLTGEKKVVVQLGEVIRKKLNGETLPLEERAKTDLHFFDWEVMYSDVFDKGGFDIVIGNPPYISAPTQVASEVLSKQRELLAKLIEYKTLYQKWDLYIPFMEKGLRMLSNGGSFAMIVPYPLTNQLYAKKFREWVVQNYNVSELVDLNGTKVFENATVSNVILFATATEPKGKTKISHISESKEIKVDFVQEEADLVQDEKTLVWNLTQEKRQGNRHPDMYVLGDFCYISKGMVLNADEKTAKGEFSKEDLISETKDDIHCREYIEAKDIERYAVKRVRYLEYNTDRVPGKLSRPTFRELYDRPKIIMNCLGGLNSSIDVTHNYLHNHSIYCAIIWSTLSDVNNKSITSSIKKFSKMKREEMEELSQPIDLRYLLGVMNSAYTRVLLDDIRGGDYHIYPEHIRNIPIPTATSDQQQPIITLVDTILSKKKFGEDTSAEEREIDLHVYKLYGLTYEEVLIVDPETPITREEYEKA